MSGGTPSPGGTPSLPPPIAQSSIASTCYAAGCVPLAFTQEDFLVVTYCFNVEAFDETDSFDAIQNTVMNVNNAIT